MLLGSLATNLVANLVPSKAKIPGRAVILAAKGTITLTNFKIQKYDQNKSKFNGVYSRNNLPKIKYGVYIINLDEYELIGTHLIALYMNGYNVTYFDTFRVEYIPKEIEKFRGTKDVTTNALRIEANYSIMCGCFSVKFFDFMLKGKSLLDYTNLFSPN